MTSNSPEILYCPVFGSNTIPWTVLVIVWLGLSGSTSNSVTGAIDIGQKRYANIDNNKAQLFKNNWYHVVLTYTYETNTTKLIVNNTLISTSQPVTTFEYWSFLSIGLGTGQIDPIAYPTTDNYYGGIHLGQFSLYDVALTTDEVNDLYNEFNIRYYTS